MHDAQHDDWLGRTLTTFDSTLPSHSSTNDLRHYRDAYIALRHSITSSPSTCLHDGTLRLLHFYDWTIILALRTAPNGYCGTAEDRLEDAAALEGDAVAVDEEDEEERARAASAQRPPRRTWMRRWRTTRRGSRRLLELCYKLAVCWKARTAGNRGGWE